MLKRFGFILLSLLLVLSIFNTSNMVFADTQRLENLEIDVYIFNDGRARIREKRNAYLTEGTENFIIINNLGGSEVRDFTVIEDGIQFDYLEEWDVDKSRQEKAYKNGIIETSDGYELCWGIGEYGQHNYELEYTITNFIKDFKDRQGLFWRFVNDKTNIPPKNVSVSIDGDHSFTSENSNIWSFGYEGSINFTDNKIVARNTRPFNESNYLTILVELEKGMYSTNAVIDMTFEEVKEEAFRGSDYGGEEKRTFDKNILYIILGVLFLPVLIVFLIVSNANKEKKKYKGQYYRDYPYEGDFKDMYFLLQRRGLSNMENLLTAFILKWINEGKLMPKDVERGRIFKREETGLKFVDKHIDGSNEEEVLFNYMLEAAGSNNILESKEFTSWSRKNFKKLTKWEEDVRDNSLDKLKDLDYVISEKKKFLFIPYDNHIVADKGEIFQANVFKFKNYLKDYSLLNEHSSINVMIWDNLMIWAGLLGITEAVQKEFKNLYPDYERESIYGNHGILVASSFSSSATSAIRSSGGGGSSSIGGGGGSFGGGSGGGTR